jgi:protein-tyrosine phosphatase
MRSILFVCTANICRSPMAEGVFRRLLGSGGMERDVFVDSAGTHDTHNGKLPAALAIVAASKRGYDITKCRSRRVSMGDFDRYDHILVMDRANLAHLRKIAPTRAKEKIELLLEYGDQYHGREVPDPYGGEQKDFEKALDMIEDGCAGLARMLAPAKLRHRN